MHDIHSKYSENETVAVQFQSAETTETKPPRAEQEMKDVKRKKKNSLFNSFILIYFIAPFDVVLFIVVFLAAYVYFLMLCLSL